MTRTHAIPSTATTSMATRMDSSTDRLSAPARHQGRRRQPWHPRARGQQRTLLLFAVVGSVALLADLVHNFGDALTAVPLGIAFFLRSFRGEKLAGLAVVAVIFASACVALYETIQRLIDPRDLSHLWVSPPPASSALPATSSPPACGSWQAGGSRVLRCSRTASMRASTDSSLWPWWRAQGVVALGFPIGDPIVGLVITLVILRVTWDAWRTVRASEPGVPVGSHRH